MSNLAKKYPVISIDEWGKEKINGVVYAMAPARFYHQNVGSNLIGIFRSYLKGKSCQILYDMIVQISDENILIPDLMVVCNRDFIERATVVGPPDLIVEIYSPSTSRRDRFDKKDLYEQFGVKEYWLVNPETREIEVYLLKEGKYEMDNLYTVYDEFGLMELDMKGMEPIYEFKTSIFDDLVINIEEVFEGLD